MVTFEQFEAFLKAYEQLCRTHNMIVDSCECCNSPWITDLSRYVDSAAEANIQRHITHLREQGI